MMRGGILGTITQELHNGKTEGPRSVSEASNYACVSKCLSGAQGRNRTADTRIFNPLLYRLSYLGKKECVYNQHLCNCQLDIFLFGLCFALGADGNVVAERFFFHIVAIYRVSASAASSADIYILALAAFAFIRFKVPQVFEYL